MHLLICGAVLLLVIPTVSSAVVSGWTVTICPTSKRTCIPASSKRWLTKASSKCSSPSSNSQQNANHTQSYAWNDSNAFIIYVPYGVKIKLTSGDFGEADQDYCETLQTSVQEKALTVCDGMNGMARIFNGNQATVGNQLMGTSPMGWNSNYEILSGQPFDTSAAIRGSVASWAAGDFNYDVSDKFSDQLNSGVLDPATAVAIGNLNISESTAGFFNIPVCKVYDLASFPPATPNGYPCACAYSSAVSKPPFLSNLTISKLKTVEDRRHKWQHKVIQGLRFFDDQQSRVSVSNPHTAVPNSFQCVREGTIYWFWVSRRRDALMFQGF